MRVAERGEVWEWCSWDDQLKETKWEPVLLLERIEPSKSNVEGLYNWVSLDLLTGEVEIAFNVPRLGWEKVE